VSAQESGNNETNQLIIQATSTWNANEWRYFEVLTVDSQLGLRLPTSGLRAGHITYASDAHLGPILPTGGWSAGIGAFEISYLGFARAEAAVQNEMVLLLSFSTALLVQDSFTVVLPFFSINSSSSGATAQVDAHLMGAPIDFAGDPSANTEAFARDVLGQSSLNGACVSFTENYTILSYTGGPPVAYRRCRQTLQHQQVSSCRPLPRSLVMMCMCASNSKRPCQQGR